MYEISIEREFCAAHAIEMRGVQEPVHGHNWHVTAVLAGRDLDADGLLTDFHQLERQIDGILEPLHNADLNATPPFDAVNPTAEHVARYIAESLAEIVADGATVSRVSVTEAPGCTATYRMDRA
jgi:6-pyruvoyltetrahydropterin/6-carboxytetrahydropterin synthase